MIKNTEIMIALGDDTYYSLFHKMNKYVAISITEVQEIIQHGVKGIYEKHEALVAWLLKLTKYIPVGFIPTLRKVEKKQQQLSLPMSTSGRDQVSSGTKRGKAHGNYKNGSYSLEAEDGAVNKSGYDRTNCIRGEDHHGYGKHEKIADHNEKKAVRKYKAINNASRVKVIIHTIGGAPAVAIIAGVGERSVRDWHKLTKRGTQGYIPVKYIYKLSKFARDYNLNISREELESFLPPKFEDYL